MAKILVGMSGGVDSAVAAYLLKEAGHEVSGVTLRTWVSENGKESRCCEIDDARKTAWKLQIPYYALNCISEFQRSIIDPFVRDYLSGITPNPCVFCNREIKWEKLLYAVKVRYHHSSQAAWLEMLEAGRARITFAEPVRAAAPGQSAVFYDEEDCVIGGGIILPER